MSMNVQVILSESLNILLPVMVRWCIIMNQSAFQKDWFAAFKVKVTVMDHIIKVWLSNTFSELLIFLQLNLVWWHIIVGWIVLWKDCIALLWSWSRTQEGFKIPMKVFLDNISSTAEPFVTKLGMVIHHHRPECLVRRLVCCLQGQGHSEGSYNRIGLFLPYLLNCWSFCNQI